ncbi:MAG: class I SAM-dependent methyltransferase [Acidimicrobiales bacterium]
MDGSAAELNRANWDARAVVHGQDRYYDTAALIAGRISLGEEERAAIERTVGDVRGLDICHVQCHIGFDSILLARAGGRVTGLDFSQASLSKAGSLAQQCGVDLTLVEADACDPPHYLDNSFDLVYATIGVLPWIEDVDAWMASAARLARTGGHLVLVDGHPLVTMFDTYDPPAADFPYNFDGPHHFDGQGTYADWSAQLSSTRTVQYAHGLGEIVTAAIDADWAVCCLEEATSVSYNFRGDLGEPEEDGRYRVRLGGEPIPILYTLLARRR